jgi:hypothetical protein
MKGIMNAMYTGSERDAENKVLSLIQKVMSTEVVRVKGVSQVQYIGDRERYEVSPVSITNAGESTTSSGNANPIRMFEMGVGIAVGAAVVVGLAVGIFVAKIVKKKSDKDSVTGDNVSVTSIEVMGELDQDKKIEEPESKTETESSLAEKGTFPTDSETPNVQESEVVVPVAMTQSQSLPSQRRRRRKKKKKKKKTRMVLTRSNSVNSMDTITEEGEEEDDEDSDDCGFDFGSEYSTDDEDDFYLVRTGSTRSLDSAIEVLTFPLEQVAESPRIKKLPPPPV